MVFNDWIMWLFWVVSIWAAWSLAVMPFVQRIKPVWEKTVAAVGGVLGNAGVPSDLIELVRQAGIVVFVYVAAYQTAQAGYNVFEQAPYRLNGELELWISAAILAAGAFILHGAKKRFAENTPDAPPAVG